MFVSFSSSSLGVRSKSQSTADGYRDLYRTPQSRPGSVAPARSVAQTIERVMETMRLDPPGTARRETTLVLEAIGDDKVRSTRRVWTTH
jgi:hypothetical protein